MKILTPLKAIRAKCIDCCCGNTKEPARCTITDCSLYPYRKGHRPPKEEADVETDVADDDVLDAEDECEDEGE